MVKGEQQANEKGTLCEAAVFKKDGAEKTITRTRSMKESCEKDL